MGCGASDAASASNTIEVADPGGSMPLRQPGKYQAKPAMTFEALKSKRTEFWDTRVHNNSTTWSNLKMAADAMLDKDVDTANAIVAAADIRTPQGSLELVYDERGSQYRVPQYCWNTPSNLLDDDFANAHKAAADNGAASPAGVSWALTLRVGPGARPDQQLAINSGSTVRQLKEELVAQSPPETDGGALSADRMRIMFWGKELKDAEVLSKTRVENNAVVQVFVRPQA